MVTVDDAARAVLQSADTDAHFQKAVDWCSDRYRELTNRVRFRALREVGELVIPAAIQTGTVTITRGSAVVTGNAAAQAVWTIDLAGRYIKVRGRHNWHKIGAVVVGATTELRLATPFAEDSVSGASYDLVARFHELDPRARHLGKFVWMRLGRELSDESAISLDIIYPERLLVSASGPTMVAERGRSDDGRRVVEIYPYPTESELIHYVFWPHSPQLRPGDPLPEGIDPYVLREGALVDLYRYEASRALHKGGEGAAEAAATYGNWAARQLVLWKQAMQDAATADKGLNDITMILRSGTFTHSRSGDFMNSDARSEIFIRGNRP